MKKAISTLLFIVPVWLYAASFVVTTNATTGPGSIYEALNAAAQNGSATTDTILFNLPDGQTTITINNNLLASSNLIIDGTTQPTKPFGTSNARVRIKASGCLTGLLVDGLQHVEVYGLWFSDFNASSLTCSSSAISIRNTDGFTLGSPGRGNCFSNNLSSVTNPWQLSGDLTENTRIKIQSNHFGMDTSNAPDFASGTIAFGATRNFLFGGDEANEGNRIGNAFITVGNIHVPLSAAGDSIIFKNNFFGFDPFNGPLNSAIGLYIAGYESGGSSLSVLIENNKIGKDDATNKIWITHIKGNIIIRNNYIGSLNTVVTPGDLVAGIYMGNCQKKDSISIKNNTINGYSSGIVISETDDVTILNNSFYCNRKGISYESLNNVPIVFFDELTANFLKGTTQPLSLVEIFSTSECNEFCENGKVLLATVLADAGGNFSYSGALPGKISATATSPSGSTGEFYSPKFSIQNINTRNATCGQKNGFITGIKIIQGNTFHWEDEAGNIVSTDTSVYNLGAGKYRFYIKDSLSSCPVYSDFITLITRQKPVVDSSFSVVNAKCGKSIGQVILNGTRPAATDVYWLDSTGKVLQNYGDSIISLPAGTYSYKLFLSEDTACFTDYGPFTIIDNAGPGLVTTNVTIKESVCGESNGSITNLSFQNANGSVVFRWEDSTGVLVGSAIDLLNVPGGKYRLKFKDDSVCDTIVSPYFTVSSNGGIVIDSSQRIIKATKCIGSTGSITNIKTSKADYFQWINISTNQIVGSQLDLQQVPSGNYQLNAGNAIGCRDTSTIMFVPGGTFAPITIQNMEHIQPHCDMVNGSLQIKKFSSDSTLYNFTWTDSTSGATVSNTAQLINVNSGSYILNAVDTNGCAAKLLSIKMLQVGKPVIDLSQVILQSDTCNQAIGLIKNIVVTGGEQPYTWQWFKSGTTSEFANTAAGLQNLKQGVYYAGVSDRYQCNTVSDSLEISNYDKILSAPLTDKITVKRNTVAELIIKNSPGGTFSLYDTANASLPIRISNTSRLVTPVVAYNKTFYVQNTLGSCVSPWQPVPVTVFDQSKLSLPNAFSPNGDGINDVFTIQVDGLITINEWLIFNRYGQLIFSTKDIGTGWDGRVKNAYVPMGTYYWIVNAKDNTGKEIKQQGSVTVLR